MAEVMAKYFPTAADILTIITGVEAVGQLATIPSSWLHHTLHFAPRLSADLLQLPLHWLRSAQ